MKNIFYISFLVLASIVSAQTANFGDQATLYLGENTTFYFGGNTTLNGPINNSGTIVSSSDIDFVLNRVVGSLKFRGPNEQNLNGDTLEVVNFIVDKQGQLNLLTDRILVFGALETVNGVIDAEEDDIIVSGSSDGSGQGYVEGKLVGISQGAPVTFPMGVNGAPNYVTIADLPNNTQASVEIQVPDVSSLIPNEDIVGISDEVEWILKVVGDSINTRLEINFSGVDLLDLPNSQNIRAFDYQPAIVIYSPNDTTYIPVEGTVSRADADFTTGTITSDESIWITEEGKRIAIALVPVIVTPTFFVPNAFAPNGTIDENRIFRPYFAGATVSSYAFDVYDSFNQLVYTANQSGEELDITVFGWNGVLNSGQEAPEGVYYYNVRIVAESEEYTKTGSVFLVK